METLKIEIPNGYQIDSFDKQSGEIKFKAKPTKTVTQRITSVDDVILDNGILPNTFERQCSDLSPDEKAYRILKLLAKSLNEGWVPDWNNSNEYKYFPWFEMRGSSGFQFFGCDDWAAGSGVGSRLCFKSRELADYAGKTFTQVYKQFMVIE